MESRRMWNFKEGHIGRQETCMSFGEVERMGFNVSEKSKEKPHHIKVRINATLQKV